MLERLTEQTVKEMATESLIDYRAKALSEKSALEKLEKPTEKQVAYLNDLASSLALIDKEEERLSSSDKPKTKSPKRNAYTPAPGTEGLVHAQLIRGRRFNPRTGKEESQPFIQMFTFPEWQLFRKNYVGLGYEISKVLYNPYDKED